MYERSNELINSIAQAAFNAIPVDDWNRFIVEVRILNKIIELEATYFDLDGNAKSFDPEQEGGEDLSLLFKELREVTHAMSPGLGAWFHAALEVDASGEFDIQYEYDKKPNFTAEPDSSKYKDDLQKFPREKELIPDWLNEILSRSN